MEGRSELMSQHLDRDRPPWTFDGIGPLTDGREAIAARIHHAMADGIAAVRFLHTLLWDPHAEPAANGPHPGLRAEVEREPLVEALRLPGAVLRELGHRVSDSPFDRWPSLRRSANHGPPTPRSTTSCWGSSRAACGSGSASPGPTSGTFVRRFRSACTTEMNQPAISGIATRS
jgi:Wax ester synthase-like Acyl-CoA acyltransferase domain